MTRPDARVFPLTETQRQSLLSGFSHSFDPKSINSMQMRTLELFTSVNKKRTHGVSLLAPSFVIYDHRQNFERSTSCRLVFLVFKLVSCVVKFFFFFFFILELVFFFILILRKRVKFLCSIKVDNVSFVSIEMSSSSSSKPTEDVEADTMRINAFMVCVSLFCVILVLGISNPRSPREWILGQGDRRTSELLC